MSFGLSAMFSRDKEEMIEQEFDGFIEGTVGEIESWSEKGSRWVLESINISYVNVARYVPLRGGTYLPLPA